MLFAVDLRTTVKGNPLLAESSRQPRIESSRIRKLAGQVGEDGVETADVSNQGPSNWVGTGCRLAQRIAE